MKPLVARDLLELEDLTRADEEWLRRLQHYVRSEEHVIRVGDAREDPEPIVSCGYDGRWRAGRYIGAITFEGRRISIEPRFPYEVLASWMGAALNLVIVPSTTGLRRSEAVIPMLLALVWCRELDEAARHGLPFLREDRVHTGLAIRGRLLPARTVRERLAAKSSVASASRERTLNHDVARTIVCAQRALSIMLGHDLWMTRRARDLMPHLWAAVGTRPRLPTQRALRRIRYTPIRRPFKPFVERCWQIARQQGFMGGDSDDRAEGVLLDVAELWERFVLGCAQESFPNYEVVHGTEALDAVHPCRNRVGARCGRHAPPVVHRGSRR